MRRPWLGFSAVIVDLDRPWEQLFRVNQQALISAQQSMSR